MSETTRKIRASSGRALLALLPSLGAVWLSSAVTAAESSRFQELAEVPFEQDYPTKTTARQLEDELFFQRAVQVYHWALPAMNMFAMKEGAETSYGAGYNVMSIWKQRLNAKTLITTPNSDVIYGIGFLDLETDGPMVIDAPPKLQALIDDFWHRPIDGPTIDGHTYYADIGLPGPDKGKGGKYLIVPPGYEGKVPDSGFYVYRSRTYGVFVFLRGFFDNPNDLMPAVSNMQGIRIYPLGKEKTAKAMAFPDASGKSANLLAPSDGRYFALLDRFIQAEVVDPSDHYMRGMAASIGIVKEEPFQPSEHDKELLDLAARTAWKMSKVVAFDEFETLPKARWYPDRQWLAHVRNGGEDFRESVDNFYFEVDGKHYTDLDARLHMFINAYSMSPGMMTSIPGVGAKYLEAAKDSAGDFLAGGRTYTLTLPPKVPANLFWSVTAYDASTAAGLDNGQPFPSIGSRDDPEKNGDGSITLYFGPEAPPGKEKNWVRTVPGKGWFTLLRLYGPEKPFFDKTWVPGDFERLP